VAVAAGQTHDELESMLLAIGPSILDQPHSFGAWDGAELIGAVLSTAFTWMPPDGAGGLSPNYRPIGAIIGALETGFEAQPQDKLQTCLHIHMLAVSRGFRGHRIAEHLVNTCIESAATHGFQEVVSDATNPASQQVFTKTGFARLTEQRYADFDFEGRRCFSEIETAPDIALMWRAI
jgi:ribosomal protein S18 acetylase RimI-like enzyme